MPATKSERRSSETTAIKLSVVGEPKEPCASCKDMKRERTEMRARMRELEAQNERLTRAIQRESHHIDERVIRNR